MMLDADVVAASLSSVYGVLRDAGLMERHNTKWRMPFASSRAMSGITMRYAYTVRLVM
jgi:hypothetical protein